MRVGTKNRAVRTRIDPKNRPRTAISGTKCPHFCPGLRLSEYRHDNFRLSTRLKTTVIDRLDRTNRVNSEIGLHIHRLFQCKNH